MTIDGINPSDPGRQLLQQAVADIPGECLWLVHCGGFQGIKPHANRLILDIREQPVAGEQCIPDRLPLHLQPTATEPQAPTATASDAVVWPRAHLGRDFTERCLALATSVLKPGGRLWCAARKSKGGKTIAGVMKSMVGNVEVVRRNRGYHLYRSELIAPDLTAVRERLDRTYSFEHPLLPAAITTVPGVFSRTHLDRGTAALIEFLATTRATSRATRVLDLCAGVGPLGLWALKTWPNAQAWAVDSNILATALTTYNARVAGMADRMHIHLGDGLRKPSRELARHRGRFDLALVNPPTHAPVEAFAALITSLKSWLRPGAEAFIVVNRAGRLQKILAESAASVEVHSVPGFELVRATWPQPA